VCAGGWHGCGSAGRPAPSLSVSDAQFEADLLGSLPPGLLAAMPGLFIATAQARAGRSSRQLVRIFGLPLRDAKTILRTPPQTTTNDIPP
jgi:hypothetical protein